MDFPPPWLLVVVVLATLATLADVLIARQWPLVAIVLIILVIEVFMSGPVELASGWVRVRGRLGSPPNPGVVPEQFPREQSGPRSSDPPDDESSVEPKAARNLGVHH